MIKTSIRLLALSNAFALAFLALLTFVSINSQIPMGTLTRDPATLEGFHPLIGILSNLGILLWCGTAAVCLFGAVILHQNGSKNAGRFLAGSAFLTFFLLFDDFFLFHDVLSRQYFGIREKGVYVIIVTITIIYAAIFWRTILKTEYIVLGFALILLASSLGIDALLAGLTEKMGEWSFLVEDGLKFLGIVAWCNYFIGTSYRFVVEGLSNAIKNPENS